MDYEDKYNRLVDQVWEVLYQWGLEGIEAIDEEGQAALQELKRLINAT